MIGMSQKAVELYDDIRMLLAVGGAVADTLPLVNSPLKLEEYSNNLSFSLEKAEELLEQLGNEITQARLSRVH